MMGIRVSKLRASFHPPPFAVSAVSISRLSSDFPCFFRRSVFTELEALRDTQESSAELFVGHQKNGRIVMARRGRQHARSHDAQCVGRYVCWLMHPSTSIYAAVATRCVGFSSQVLLFASKLLGNSYQKIQFQYIACAIRC